ncbi:lysine exporter LysO family protein [Fervidibacter sp.]
MAGALALLSFTAGVLLARLNFLPTLVIDSADGIGFAALCWMVFAVGVVIGSQKDVWHKALREGWRLLLLPVGTLLLSALTAGLVGKLLGMPVTVGAAIGSACGWYSLSGVAVAKIWGAEVGLVAFAVNFLRELLAFCLIPLLARFSRLATIALCGATAADTTLPVIAKSTDPKGALVGLISGGLITALVPLTIALLSWLTK